ncbi:MAG: helix-turn-helix transcriptional regulator [Candidatus Gastranaerophilales bacterium]|nr:helix-turn-helix transcriptional regulator [Candidatus Gastranaerophilales bacterium]
MQEDFYKNLARNIKSRRKELHLTQQELADRLDMSLNFVGKIEVAFSKPSLDTLIKISEKLGTSVSELTKFD